MVTYYKVRQILSLCVASRCDHNLKVNMVTMFFKCTPSKHYGLKHLCTVQSPTFFVVLDSELFADSLYPIQLFRSMRYCIAFLRSVEQWDTVCRGTLRFILAQWSNEWKRGVITQNARIHTIRAPFINHRHSLVGGVTGFRVISHGA